MSKSTFIAQATAYGVSTSYSGGTNTMYVKGDDTKVKSFIRIQCLKGKGHYPFAFAKG